MASLEKFFDIKDRNAGSEAIDIYSDILQTITSVSFYDTTAPYWISGLRLVNPTGTDIRYFTFYYLDNDEKKARSFRVTLKIDSRIGNLTYTEFLVYDIYQNYMEDGISDFGIQPAYKKDLIHYVHSDNGKADIKIKKGAVTLLESSSKYTGADEYAIKINILDTIRGFIEDIPFNDTANSVKNIPISDYRYIIEVSYEKEGSTATDVLNVIAFNDYSYDSDYSDNVTYKLYSHNAGIINRYGENCFAVLNNGNLYYSFSINNQSGVERIYAIAPKSFGIINFIYEQDNISTINGDAYELIDCPDLWNVSFLNKFGGWETIVCRGNYQITEDYNRYNYLNKDLDYRIYKTETKRTLTVNTNWLEDSVSEHIGDLMASNCIILSKSGESASEAVKTRNYAHITNQNTEIKTFRRNGRTLNNYKINFEIDKTYTRR